MLKNAMAAFYIYATAIGMFSIRGILKIKSGITVDSG